MKSTPHEILELQVYSNLLLNDIIVLDLRIDPIVPLDIKDISTLTEFKNSLKEKTMMYDPPLL